jgi:hypothetical protein
VSRRWSRREFLAAGLAAPAAGLAQSNARPRDSRRARRRDGTGTNWLALGARLAPFGDPSRHFVFEYYPWYGAMPWVHWNENLRVPPFDIAASSMPLLGPYDSDDVRVIEQHARWIREAGVGAINLSWWGRDDPIDARVHPIMDVMRAHDIRVTFHLEPYVDDRALRYRGDVLYLLEEYGHKRHWDTLLLLERADGTASPVFKSFRTILPAAHTNCLGVTTPIADYTPDQFWRRETDALRTDLRSDFAEPILLCDSLDAERVAAAGFDGLGLYDPFVRPSTWTTFADEFSSRDLLFSFNVNVGFDKYPARNAVDPCFVPLPFEPGPLDWSHPSAREAAEALGRTRFAETTERAIGFQTDPKRSNARKGVFVVYINSFNEWHEGTAFEPARDFEDLGPEELAVGYHNVTDGRWRLDLLGDTLAEVFEGARTARTGARRRGHPAGFLARSA